MNRVTLELASALPVIVGVELFVMEEEVDKEVGAFGADVSIVIEIEEDFNDIFPEASVAVALIE